MGSVVLYLMVETTEIRKIRFSGTGETSNRQHSMQGSRTLLHFIVQNLSFSKCNKQGVASRAHEVIRPSIHPVSHKSNSKSSPSFRDHMWSMWSISSPSFRDRLFSTVRKNLHGIQPFYAFPLPLHIDRHRDEDFVRRR